MTIEALRNTNHEAREYQLKRTTQIIDGVHATVHSELSEETVRSIPEGVLATLYMGVEMGPEFQGRKNQFARNLGFTYTPDFDSEDPENTVIMTNKNINNGVIYEAKLRHTGTGYEAHGVVFESVTVKYAKEA